MNIITFFTLNGQPADGLIPSMSIWQDDGTLLVETASMTEISGGFYKYDFSTYDTTLDYVFRADGGTALPLSERYSFGSNDLGQVTEPIYNISESLNIVTSSVDNISSSLGVSLDNIEQNYDEIINVSSSLGVSLDNIEQNYNEIINISTSIVHISSSVNDINLDTDSLTGSLDEISGSLGIALDNIEQNYNEIISISGTLLEVSNSVNNINFDSLTGSLDEISQSVNIVDNRVINISESLNQVSGSQQENSEKINYVLGLVQQNFRIKNQNYDGSGNLLSATVRIYDTANDTINDQNEIKEYIMSSSYNVDGHLTSYRMFEV